MPIVEESAARSRHRLPDGIVAVQTRTTACAVPIAGCATIEPVRSASASLAYARARRLRGVESSSTRYQEEFPTCRTAHPHSLRAIASTPRG